MNSILNESFSNLEKNASSVGAQRSAPASELQPAQVKPVQTLPEDNVQLSDKANEATFKFKIEASITIFKGSTQAASFKFEQSGEADADTLSELMEQLAEMMQEFIEANLEPEQAEMVNNVFEETLDTAVDLFSQTIDLLEATKKLVSPAEDSRALIDDFSENARQLIQSVLPQE